MAAVMKYISNTQSEMNETWEGVLYILHMQLSHSLKVVVVVVVAFANSYGTVLKFYFSVVRRVKYGPTPNINGRD